MKMIMALAVAMLLAGCFPTAAEEDGVGMSVLHQLFSDYTECFAYHMLAKQCAPENATEAQLAPAQSMIDRASEDMATTGQLSGMSVEAMAAEEKFIFEDEARLTTLTCVLTSPC